MPVPPSSSASPAGVAPAHGGAPAPRPEHWAERLTGPWAAAFVLVVFWIVLLAATNRWSMTFDEGVHALAGTTYWSAGDFRYNPENGNLPQRLAGLGTLAAAGETPVLTGSAPTPPQWIASDRWLFHTAPNDPAAILRAGRAAMSVLAVALGALVWWWARKLFDATGGMVALLLYTTSPTVLANGALITSDLASALGFLGATFAFWALLHHVTPGRIALAGLASGALALSKMSAVLLGPIGVALLALRLLDGRPLAVTPARRTFVAHHRGHQARWLIAAALAHLVIAWAVIWAAYGFRFAAVAPGRAPAAENFAVEIDNLLGKPPPYVLLDELALDEIQSRRAVEVFQAHQASADTWTRASRDAFAAVEASILRSDQQAKLAARRAASAGPWASRVIDFVHRHELLPEAFVYGVAHAHGNAQARPAFLDGEIRWRGWTRFFPLTALYKTPLPVFALLLLALATAFAIRTERRTWERFYPTLPLWLLFAGYSLALLGSTLNIGHRHTLPTWPPLFILGGAVASWLVPNGGNGRRVLGGLTAVLLLWLPVEAGRVFPNYLAYFNPPSGGLARAHTRLIDSSLDWGQDLPAVQRYLAARPANEPTFLSYFGADYPPRFGIKATPLHSRAGWGDANEPWVQLHEAGAAEPTQFLRELLARRPGFELLATTPPGQPFACLLRRQADAFVLRPGTYLISASMLQPYTYREDEPRGPWTAAFESEYQSLQGAAAIVLGDDSPARREALRASPPEELSGLLHRFDVYRFARLTAWLRRRAPDETINGSVLVYRLSAADLASALEGAAPLETANEAAR